MPSLSTGLRAAIGGLPRPFYVLLAGMFVNRLATFVAIFLGPYLVNTHGFTPDAAGRVVALFGVGILVAGPLGGTLADAIGRRATMLLSLVSGGFAVLGVGLVREPTLLALFAFLSALTSEGYRPALQAAIADLVPPEERPRAFGLVYWVVNAGWTVGLLLAGFIAERSFVALFAADAATCLLFAAIIYWKVPETHPHLAAGAGGAVHPERRAREAGPESRDEPPGYTGFAQVLRDRIFLVFAALYLGALVIFLQFQLAAPLDWGAHGVGPAVYSALLSFNGLGVVVFQPLIGPWLRRFDGARLLAASALLFGLGFGVNAFGGNVPLYAFGVVLWTIGEVVGFPAGATLVADLAPVALRGRYQGAFSMSWGIAFSVAPLVGGEVLARFGAPTLWLGCLGAGVLLAGLNLLAGPARRRRLDALGIPRPGQAPDAGGAAAAAPPH
ncbi:MAG: MFS transporter [Anaeromyxobacteraceae bacterium]